jgi:hypothetical protein
MVLVVDHDLGLARHPLLDIVDHVLALHNVDEQLRTAFLFFDLLFLCAYSQPLQPGQRGQRHDAQAQISNRST